MNYDFWSAELVVVNEKINCRKAPLVNRHVGVYLLGPGVQAAF